MTKHTLLVNYRASLCRWLHSPTKKLRT